MSSEQLETQAKTKLAILVKSIEPIVEQQLAEFTPAEIEYVLANFRKHLKYDLTRDTTCMLILFFQLMGAI